MKGRVTLAWWGFVLSLLAMVGAGLFSLVVTSISVIVVTVGIPLTFLCMPWLRGFADWHRVWVAEYVGIPIARPYRPVPDGGWFVRLRAMLTDQATWRDLLWLLVNGTAGVVLALLPITFLAGTAWYAVAWPVLIGLLPKVFSQEFGLFETRTLGAAIPIGVLLGLASFLLFWFTTRPLMSAYAKLTRWLLGAGAERDRLANRIAQLTESRAETVDTQAAELRRIERDLHDGAQARLVSLGMSLGMAEELLASDPDAAQGLLAEARESTRAGAVRAA